MMMIRALNNVVVFDTFLMLCALLYLVRCVVALGVCREKSNLEERKYLAKTAVTIRSAIWGLLRVSCLIFCRVLILTLSTVR